MEGIDEIRQHLRRKILAQRDRMGAQARQAKSLAVWKRLVELPCVGTARMICAFVSYRSEVETAPFLDWVLTSGKILILPRTDPDKKRLHLFRVKDLELSLRPGYCGILEPDPERSEADEGDQIDVVVVPGAVFDRTGGRLGYGGGFYDRLLAGPAARAQRLGVGFAEQVVEGVPLLPHDQRLDWLVTDRETIHCRRGGGDAQDRGDAKRGVSGA